MPLTPEKKSEYDRKRHIRNKEFLQNYKLDKGCMDCGYNKHHAALQFDHIPNTEKKFSVGSGTSQSKKMLMEEINKCEVVCANCHTIRTFDRGQLSTQLKRR